MSNAPALLPRLRHGPHNLAIGKLPGTGTEAAYPNHEVLDETTSFYHPHACVPDVGTDSPTLEDMVKNWPPVRYRVQAVEDPYTSKDALGLLEINTVLWQT